MPTEENKDLKNWWNTNSWNWSNDTNISSNDAKKTDSLDLDIDLNLDWIDIDDSAKWEINDSSQKTEIEDWKNNIQDWNKKIETEIKKGNVKQDNEELNNSQENINIEPSKNLEEAWKKESFIDKNDKSNFVGEELEVLEPINDGEDLWIEEKKWLIQDKKQNVKDEQKLDIDKIWKPSEKISLETQDTSKKEWNSVENDDNDWLAEEDKKVEEKKKSSLGFDNWDKEKNISNIEKVTNEKKDNINLEDLDIPFVDKDIDKENKLNFDDNLKTNQELEELSNKKENTDSLGSEEKKDSLDLGSLDIPEKNSDEIEKSSNLEKDENWLHKENLWEDVLENKDGDIVSDTGDLNSKWNVYIPNEHDFSQTVGALNSKEKGQIDLDSLQKDQKKSDNSQLETDDSIKSQKSTQEWSLDLDSMISNFENNDLWKDENKKNSWVNLDVENDKSEETVVEQQNRWLDNDQSVTKSVNGNIDLWSAEVNNNSDLEKTPIEQNLDQSKQSVNQVNNQDINSPKAVVFEDKSKLKNKHSWLKIFILIILLLFWWVLILSKMYPEEFGDIMSAIKWEDTTVVEYSENSNLDTVLENTGNTGLNTWENVLNTGEIVEEPDPDSLAWQIEWTSGTNNNVIEYDTWDVLVDTWHGSDEESFDAFEDLDEAIDSVDSQYAEVLDSLLDYKKQWDEYNEWGRSQWNTTAMKYGLYISRNAEELINDIENNIKIDMNEVDKYFAQFDVYLEKLSWLRESIEWVIESDNLDSSVENDDTTEQSSWTVQEL